MNTLTTQAAVDLIKQQKGVVMVLASAEEITALKGCGLKCGTGEPFLSMQHLAVKEAELQHERPIVLTVVPEEPNVTSAAERGLIYAMMLRCRKAISCRDKLEDLLRNQEPATWPQVKAAYEERVLDLFKKTWRTPNPYPYMIVDNIKVYNRGESYIMRALHEYLSERHPGQKNTGDAAVIASLKQMFAEISLNVCQPQLLILGKNIDVPSSIACPIYELNCK